MQTTKWWQWWLVVVMVGVVVLTYLHTQDVSILQQLGAQQKDNTEDIMRIFRAADREFLKAKLYSIDMDKETEQSAMVKFYELVARPVQGVCRTMKRFGGAWFYADGAYAALDGDKFACLDKISKNKNCTVYSFGVNNEWSFEDMIARMGCDVWAYDPSHGGPAMRGERIRFAQLGVASEPGTNLQTLDNMMATNKHTHITYLKMDIEGGELTCLPKWVETGVINQLDQFALEFHLGSLHGNPPRFKWLLQLLKQLHDLGFRVISYEPNMVMGKMSGYYQLFEIVFKKDNEWNYLDSEPVQ